MEIVRVDKKHNTSICYLQKTYLKYNNICGLGKKKSRFFKAALFVIAKNWKQPKYSVTHLWLNKLWYIHITKYYSAIKRNKLLRCMIQLR